MSKLKLNLDEIKVESFETNSGFSSKGTILGHDGEVTGYMGCTIYPHATCGAQMTCEMQLPSCDLPCSDNCQTPNCPTVDEPGCPTIAQPGCYTYTCPPLNTKLNDTCTCP